MKSENHIWLRKIKNECKNLIEQNEIFEDDKENLIFWANKLEVE